MSPPGRPKGEYRSAQHEGGPASGTVNRHAFAQRLREGAQAFREGWMQICGIPDYERYLAHHAAHHPDESVLSRKDFFAQAIDRKYCKSGPRCC